MIFSAHCARPNFQNLFLVWHLGFHFLNRISPWEMYFGNIQCGKRVLDLELSLEFPLASIFKTIFDLGIWVLEIFYGLRATFSGDRVRGGT